jgi:hypothetical protein
MGLKLSLNSNWKGGRFIASSGYVLVKDTMNPGLRRDGYSYEHRLVAEKIIGRPLRKGEIVHHKDGNKLNNDPLNLEVLPSIAHHKAIHRKREGRREPGEENILVLCACGCGARFLKYDDSNRPRRFIFSGHSRRKGNKE